MHPRSHHYVEDIEKPLPARASVRRAQPRVLVFGPFLPPEVACGISSAVRSFLASRVTDWYELESISTFRTPRDRGLLERLTWGAWLTSSTLARVIGRRAVLSDVHAVSGPSLLSHAAVLIGTRLAGRPALLRIHGGDFDRVFEESSDAGKALIRLILRTASCVVVLGETWRTRVQAIEPRAQIEVIPNSVDCTAYENVCDTRKRDARNILFLANFCERKGHFDALEALVQLAPRHPAVKLQLAGEDRDAGTRARLEQEARRLGVADRIEFLGVISGADKDQAIRNADIFILPSHTENMPVSIIEGMAAGLPVVATRVGAVTEMIEDEKSGLLIDPQDPQALAQRLDRLLCDSQLREDLGQGARRRACSFWDANVVAERNLALYDRLLDENTARPA